jgi:hypothetical protein
MLPAAWFRYPLPRRPAPAIVVTLAVHQSEKDAIMLAQKLGQLRPFKAAFPQECMGQLASFGPTYHLIRWGRLERMRWHGGNAFLKTCADQVPPLAQGESVIKSPSPLNVLKDTYDHSCIEHVQMISST